MIQFLFFGSCIGSVLTAALLHWMYQGAFAKWERKALAEIARLRLTDAEREVIKRTTETLRYLQADYGKTQTEQDAAVLDGLLERLGGGR